MYQVVKRDGKVVDFDLSKIGAAITKAFEAQNRQYTQSIIDLLALRATADYEKKIKDGLVHVEDIQDSVEAVLEQAGYADVAKAYILYRKQREKVRNAGATLLDYKDLVDQYVKVEDWRVKENSTVTYSVGGLILSNSGAITANYTPGEAALLAIEAGCDLILMPDDLDAALQALRDAAADAADLLVDRCAIQLLFFHFKTTPFVSLSTVHMPL